jgi:hypothetical protein
MQSNFKYLAALGALALGLGGTQASAHHSFAMFDNTKNVVLEGTVKEFQWTNPHTWIEMTVIEAGKPVNYSIEGASPNSLVRRSGWNRTSIKAGDHVKLTIHPMKDGSKGGSFVAATFADGHTLGAE